MDYAVDKNGGLAVDFIDKLNASQQAAIKTALGSVNTKRNDENTATNTQITAQNDKIQAVVDEG